MSPSLVANRASLASSLISVGVFTAVTISHNVPDAKKVADALTRLVVTGKTNIPPSVKGSFSALFPDRGLVTINLPLVEAPSTIICGPTPTFFDPRYSLLAYGGYKALGACVILALGTTTVVVTKLAKTPSQRASSTWRLPSPRRPSYAASGGESEGEDDDDDETPSPPNRRPNGEDSNSDEEGSREEADDPAPPSPPPMGEDGDSETQGDTPDNEQLNVAGGSEDPPPPPPPASSTEQGGEEPYNHNKVSVNNWLLLAVASCAATGFCRRFTKSQVTKDIKKPNSKPTIKTFGDPIDIAANTCPYVIPLVARVPIVADGFFEDIATSFILSALDSAISKTEGMVLPFIKNMDSLPSTLYTCAAVLGLLGLGLLTITLTFTFFPHRTPSNAGLDFFTKHEYEEPPHTVTPELAIDVEQAEVTAINDAEEVVTNGDEAGFPFIISEPEEFQIPTFIVTEPAEVDAVPTIDTNGVLSEVEAIPTIVDDEAELVIDATEVDATVIILNEPEAEVALVIEVGEVGVIGDVQRVGFIEDVHEVEVEGVQAVQVIEDIQEVEVIEEVQVVQDIQDFEVAEHVPEVEAVNDIPEVDPAEEIRELEVLEGVPEVELANAVPEHELLNIPELQDVLQHDEVVMGAMEVGLVEELPKSTLNPVVTSFTPSRTVCLVAAAGPSMWAPAPATTPIVLAAPPPARHRRRNHRARGRGGKKQTGGDNIEP